MYCVQVVLYAPTASFRIPEYHTFQQTLPLPPITTIRGILGAAAGLSCEDIQQYVKDTGLRFGVIGCSRGQYKDLWKYTKIKNKEVISAVLIRECLFQLYMTLYFVGANIDLVKKTRNWFLDPRFAITAGNSDDLVKIVDVSQVIETEIIDVYEFQNTVLPGDHSDNYISNIDIRNVPIMRNLYVPQVFLLPSEFEFVDEKRSVLKREAYTFVDIPIRLKKPILGLKMNGRSVALL